MKTFDEMVWIGETVSFNGKNAALIDIEYPFVILNTGEVKPVKVRYDKIKKINYTTPVCVQNN